MIGCTRLRAVSGILRTQRGRRGSGLGRLLAGTICAGPARSGRGLASSTPRVRLRRSPPPWLISPLRRATPLWLNSSLRRPSPLWLNSGRRRAPPTSHWSWVSSRAARRRTVTGWIADSTVYPLSPGRRRAVPTSHWPWVSSRTLPKRYSVRTTQWSM